MVPGPRSRQRGLAAIVTVAGALAIWSWSAVRQGNRTEELARGWVGEQWDVARQCFVGTPLGRGATVDAIAVQLEARLYQTLVNASEAPQPADPGSLWPAHCVRTLGSLRVGENLVGADPRDALSTLEVLAPRVIHPAGDGPAAFAVGESAARARELAEAIAQLDAVMPPGASYEPEAFPEPRIDVELVRRSMARTCTRTTRPFFEQPRDLDWIDGEEGGLRLGAHGDHFEVVQASREGTESRSLTSPDGFHAPRFISRTGQLVWLSQAGGDVSVAEGSSYPIEGLPRPARRMATCFVDGAAALAFETDETTHLALWPALSGPPERTVEVRPAPPPGGTRFFCGEGRAAFLWRVAGEWRGAVCGRLTEEGSGRHADGEGCRALPPLEVGADVALVLGVDHTLALARGPRTDIPTARILEQNQWSDPVVAVRGTARWSDGEFRVDACGVQARSADGLVWSAPTP